MLMKSNKMQHYADIYLLLNHSTCFGCPSHPSSGVHEIVIVDSGTDHTIWEASLGLEELRHSLVAAWTPHVTHTTQPF